MKSFFVYTLLLAISLVLSACGGGGSGSSGTSAPTVCPAGYTPSNGGCLPINGYTPLVPRSSLSTAFYAQTKHQYLTLGYANTSTYSPNNNFKQLLQKAMGVCDRNNKDYGMNDCNAWLNGLNDLVIEFPNSAASTAKVVFRSYPYQSPYYSYGFSLPSLKEFFLGLAGFYVGNLAGFYNPMILDMAVWPVNDSKGFQLQGPAPDISEAWNKLIVIRVDTGKIEDTTFNFKLLIDETQIASGKFVRCVTASCGI
jgi:hypothetical protein